MHLADISSWVQGRRLAVACLLVVLAVAPVAAQLMPTAADPAPAADARTLRTVGFLVVDGVYNTELTAPVDILQHIRFHSQEDWPEIFLISPDGKPVKTFEGQTIHADHSFASAPEIDLLVVPSAEGSMTTDLDNKELLDWVRQTGSQARHIMSLCDGAFVLAAAGLLDGKEATTFPGDQDLFETQFPAVKLVRDVIFVDAGHAVTSVGGARSFDPALWLVERLYGAEVARGIGKGLVLDWDVSQVPHRLAGK